MNSPAPTLVPGAGPLGLSPDEFWTAPYRTRFEIEDRLLAGDGYSLIVDAPPRVELQRRQTAPLVVMRVASLAAMDIAPFREMAFVTAVDLDLNRVYAAKAIAPTSRVAKPQQVPSGPAREGRGGEAFTIDLRERLGLPWQPTRLLATVVIHDQAGERRQIELVPDQAGFKDPEVEKFRLAERFTPNPPAFEPAPGGEYPQYKRVKGAPPIPKQLGISIDVPRIVDQAGAEAIVLKASFRLAISSRFYLVRANPGADLPAWATEHFAPDEPKPTAVVPITLLITTSKTGSLIPINVVVPTWDAVDATERESVVTGSFAIDLQKLANLRFMDQTLFVYGFSGETMSGPHLMAIVPKQVP